MEQAASNLSFRHLKFRHLVLALILVEIAVIIPMTIVGFGPKNPLFSSVLYILVMGCTCLWVLRRCKTQKIDVRQIIGKLPRKIEWLKVFGRLLAMFSFSIGSAFVFFWILSNLSPAFLEKILSDKSLSVSTTTPLLQKILLVLMLVVVAPLTEEFLFRGIILRRWAEKWGLPKALIATSVLFGMMHINPIGISMVGLIFGLLYIKTGTLWIPILYHAINNGTVALLQLLPRSKTSGSTPLQTIHFFQHYGWSGGIAMGISLFFLLGFIKQNFPKNQRQFPQSEI